MLTDQTGLITGKAAVRSIKTEQEERNEQHFKTDHLLPNLKRHTISSGAVTISAQGAKFLLNVASTMILARLLLPRDFGLVAMVTAIASLLFVLRDGGLSTATVQREGITPAQISNLFWVNLALGGLLTAIFAGMAPAIAWFYREPRLVGVTLALSITFFLRGSTVQHLALLNRQMRFKAIAVIEVSSVAAGFITGLVMALLGCRYWSLVGASLAIEATSLALTWSISRWRPHLPARGSGVRPLLNFGASIAASSFIAYLSTSVDSVLIGWRYGANSVGLYSRAVALLARPIQQLMSPISSVFVPTLARLQGDPARYRRAFLLAYETIAVVSFCCTGIIFALARPLTLVLLGHKWEKAADIFACFTIVALIRPLVNAAYWLLTTQGRGRSMMIASSILSISSIISFIVGLPFGPTGVAIAFSVSGLVIRLPVVYYTSGRTGPVRTADLWVGFIRHLPLWIFVFGATYVTRIFVSHESPLIQLFICAPVGFLAGVGFVWTFKSQRRIALHLLGALRILRQSDATTATVVSS
jgi:O-antigen/teichoic acid export membrane protein